MLTFLSKIELMALVTTKHPISKIIILLIKKFKIYITQIIRISLINLPINSNNFNKSQISNQQIGLKMTQQQKSSAKLQSKTNTNPLQSKRKLEYIWQVVFIFISVASAFLLKKVYQYQTQPQFENIRKGNVYELLIFGPIIGFVLISLQTLLHRDLQQKCNLHYLSYERYTTPEARQKRCYTLIKWAFSIIFYTISSIAAYLILIQTSFMPTWLGGNGYCTDVTRYIRQLDQATLAMKIFYIIQFGKHIGRFFHHVFIRPEGNFYQYALHHGLSTFLIFFSYLMNMWLIGIFVLFIHDVSDCVLILGRAYRDYKHLNKIVIKVIYTLGGPAWVFCRIFLLAHCCVYSSLSSAYHLILQKNTYSPTIYNLILVPGLFMGFMLSALQVLQIFWTYYIIKAFLQISVSSKIAKNTYE